jgi:cytosine/creatinine deaminase
VPSVPHAVELLRNARLADGELVDVRIEGELVVGVAPAGSLTGDDPDTTLDLGGRLLLEAAAEPHAHLDKARSFEAIQPPLGDLRAAIESWFAYVETATVESIAARARAQALDMLANGITAIRSHADVHPGFPTRSAEALVAVRDELHGLVDLELVALASVHAADDDVAAVLDLGVELVGGAPHLAEDPEGEVDRLVALAHAHGTGMDLHTDEGLDGPLTMEHFAALAGDLEHRCTASHCVRLGTLDPTHLAQVVAAVAAADLGVVSLPITNLYLQGWDHPVATPRGLTALRALLDAGVKTAAGADNVQDPFNPMGRSDPFETASLLVVAGHLDPAEAWHLVSTGAREVMGLEPAGPVPGARAELLAVPAVSLTEAIATAPADRLVVHAGRVVARTELHRTIAAPVAAGRAT